MATYISDILTKATCMSQTKTYPYELMLDVDDMELKAYSTFSLVALQKKRLQDED